MTADYDMLHWECRHIRAGETVVWGQIFCLTTSGTVLIEGCKECTLDVRRVLMQKEGGSEETVKLKVLNCVEEEQSKPT